MELSNGHFLIMKKSWSKFIITKSQSRVSMLDILFYMIFCAVLFYFCCIWMPTDREMLLCQPSKGSLPPHMWPLSGAHKSLLSL